jgi:hypothetical protein
MLQRDTDSCKRWGNMLQIDTDSNKREGKYATDRHRFLQESGDICYT